MRRAGLLGVAALALLPAQAAGTDGVPWPPGVVDIHGAPVGADRVRGHVTLLTLSTRETQPRAMRLGQEAGGRFGARPGYLSLTVANTSQLSRMLRPLAPGRIAAAEQEAVENALARQHEQGNRAATEDDVRRRVVFVHDTDGHVWRALGADPEAGGLWAGVLDATGNRVYLAREPIDEAELFRVLGAELERGASLQDRR